MICTLPFCYVLLVILPCISLWTFLHVFPLKSVFPSILAPQRKHTHTLNSIVWTEWLPCKAVGPNWNCGWTVARAPRGPLAQNKTPPKLSKRPSEVPLLSFQDILRIFVWVAAQEQISGVFLNKVHFYRGVIDIRSSPLIFYVVFFHDFKVGVSSLYTSSLWHKEAGQKDVFHRLSQASHDLRSSSGSHMQGILSTNAYPKPHAKWFERPFVSAYFGVKMP